MNISAIRGNKPHPIAKAIRLFISSVVESEEILCMQNLKKYKMMCL